MQRIKIKSDYDPNTSLAIIKNDDGDIILDISGTGEFRIATSGGQYHGNKLVRIVKLFSEIIEFLSEAENNTMDEQREWAKNFKDNHNCKSCPFVKNEADVGVGIIRDCDGVCGWDIERIVEEMEGYCVDF